MGAGTVSSRSDQVYFEIRRAIIDGRFHATQHLIPDHLGDLFHLSKTPIRDALIRLEAEGLVQSVANQGYKVRVVGKNELRDLYDFAHGILRHGILRCDSFTEIPAEGPLSNTIWDSSLDDGNVAVTAERLEAYYDWVARLCSNSAIEDAIRNFNIRTHLFRVNALELPEVQAAVSDLLQELTDGLKGNRRGTLLGCMDKLFVYKERHALELWRAGYRDVLRRPRQAIAG